MFFTTVHSDRWEVCCFLFSQGGGRNVWPAEASRIARARSVATRRLVTYPHAPAENAASSLANTQVRGSMIKISSVHQSEYYKGASRHDALSQDRARRMGVRNVPSVALFDWHWCALHYANVQNIASRLRWSREGRLAKIAITRNIKRRPLLR